MEPGPPAPSMRRALAAALLVAASAVGCLSEGGETPQTEPAPEWSFTDLDGETHDGESTRGDPVVLFFMATWCPSCQEKTDDLAAVHEEHAADGVQVFSLTVDGTETEEDLRNWKREHNQTWPHGIDEGTEVARTFGVDSQSSVVVLDDEGRLAERWGYGEATADEIDRVLASLEA